MLILLLSLLPGPAVAQDLPSDCSFDQAYIVQQLQKSAVRIPGGRVDLANRVVEWRLPSGDLVSAGQGGCYDLGTSVTIRYSHGPRPPTELAVKQLLAAVSTYWSERQAKQIAAQLFKRALTYELLENGNIGLEAPASEAFFQGFTIFMSGDEISVSWISG
ncbi:MAG: hypothetical protein ABI538_09475 [Pseudoxanthomonas sp.]